jgi:type I restriction enzyme S subunit
MSKPSNKSLSIDKSNWTKVKLGDVVAEPRDTVKDFAIEQIEHAVGLEHIDSEDIHLRRSANMDSSTTFTKKFSAGDVLFGRRRAYLKKAAQAKFSGICSGDITVLRAKEALLPELLPFVVNNDKFFDYAVKHSAGGLSPRVKFKDLAHYEFLLPPKHQQAKLAELHWAMDEVVQANKNFLEKIKLFQEVSCLQLLGLRKDGNEGRKWKIKSLLDVAPLQRGFDLPSDKLMNGKYPVCYSNGIRNQNENYMVNGPGVCTGRSGTIGNVFYIEQDYWPHNTTLWVTDFKGNHPKYIYHLYSKLHFEKKMAGTGVPTLNRNDIHQIKVRIPDIDDQISISNQLDSIENKIDHACNLFDKSKSLQKSLINQIF